MILKNGPSDCTSQFTPKTVLPPTTSDLTLKVVVNNPTTLNNHVESTKLNEDVLSRVNKAEVEENTPQVKTKKNQTAIDKLLSDAAWYTQSYGKYSSNTRSSLQRKKRERARIEQEKERLEKQRQFDEMSEEARENLAKERQEKLRLNKEQQKLKMAAKKPIRRNRSGIKSNGKKHDINKKKDYYEGSEIEKLIKAAQYFTSRGGKMRKKRQSRPPERFEPSDYIESRFQSQKQNKISLTHMSTAAKAADETKDRNISSENDINQLGKNGVKKCKNMRNTKKTKEVAINWFTTISDDSVINLTDEWDFMDDFVYSDDIPSDADVPAIQACTLCTSGRIEHHFFRGQTVYLHYPLSEYREKYSLSLPRSETLFNPFDEIGKMMELIAFTFFPERELQMVINHTTPKDCIVGRYIKAFELYDEAESIIEKSIKAAAETKNQGRTIKKRSLSEKDSDYNSKEKANKRLVVKIEIDEGSGIVTKTKRTRNVKKIKTEDENLASLTNTNAQSLPTPVEKSETPEAQFFSSYERPLPNRLWDKVVKPMSLLDKKTLKPLGLNEMDLIKGIKDCIDEFNTLVDKLRNEGTTFNVMRSRQSIPVTIIYEVLNQCYSRAILPDCRKLKGYKAFSSTTYGELMPTFLSKVYAQVGLNRHKRFMDLGSGVGNCTIQAALEFGATSYGVEIMKNASELAEHQKLEFERRCNIWGFKPGKVKLFGNQSFVDNPAVKDVVNQCEVLLINNYLFDYELNKKVVDLLQDIKVGTKIISLKPIVPPGYTTSWSTCGSILDRMKTTKHIYGENSVSWTFNGGYYYITEVMNEITDENFLVVRRRNVKANTGSDSSVNLNAFTNNV